MYIETIDKYGFKGNNVTYRFLILTIYYIKNKKTYLYSTHLHACLFQIFTKIVMEEFVTNLIFLKK